MTARRYPGLPGLRAALAAAPVRWTQARLAARLGYTPGYLSAVARGRVPAADWVPARICTLLATDLWTLYQLKGGPVGHPAPPLPPGGRHGPPPGPGEVCG